MSKKTLKKVLSRAADIDKSLAVIRRAVETRETQREALKFDPNAEKACRAAAERRLAYVSAVYSSADLAELRIAISEVARRRGEFPSPSLTTILRWRRWINSDGTLPLHLLQNKHKGARQSRKNCLYED